MNFTKESTLQAIVSILVVFVALLTTSNLMSQNDSFNYENELSQRAPVASSPEAAAFSQYGDVGVNMYTGTPNIQVPIYTHQGRELNLPISLTYDATGIKVTQMPSPVGLGWNLNVGGRISRMVNGLPDDYINAATTGAYTSWYNSTVSGAMSTYSDPNYRFGVGSGGDKIYGNEQSAKNYLEFLDKLHDQEYETQPDYYSLNVMGMNETFVLDLATKNPFSLSNPNTKITRSAIGQDGIDTFTVKSDNGTRYTFQAVEETRMAKDNDTGSHFMYGTSVRFKSSWYLTEVVSPLGKDTYSFSYITYSDNRDKDYGQAVSEANTIMRTDPNDRTESISRSGAQTFFYNRKILDKVVHNGKVIIDVDFVNDFGGGPDVAISAIKIYNDGNQTLGTSLSKSFDLNYSYFKTDVSESITIANKDNIRLKLDAIQIKDSNLGTEKSYSFDYISPNSISELNSKGQDYLGFYNGQSNTVLYPKSASTAGGFPYSYGYQFAGATTGAIRSASFGSAQKGLLQEINYPTGGRTVFEYEQARTRKPDNSTAIQLVEKININHSTSSLPTVSSNECNRVMANGPDISASLATQSFSIPLGEVGTHYLNYTRTGSPTITGLGSTPKNVVIVKKPDAATTYTWAQIYDNNCDVLIAQNDIIWSYQGTDSTITDNFYLSEGHYQVFVLLYDIGFTKSLQIEGPEPFVVYDYIEELRAGIRVKTIKDYVQGSIVAKQRSYEYVSGIEIATPIFEYITQERYATVPYGNFPPGVTPTAGNYEVVHRMSQPMNAGKQHMAYPIVKELIEDPNDVANNIFKVYKFNTPNKSQGVYSQGNYQVPLEGGQFSSTNYSRHPNFGALKGSQTTNTITNSEYANSREFYSTFGLAINSLGRNNDKYPVIVGDGNGDYIIQMQLGQIATMNATSDYGYAFTSQPLGCNGEENCSPEIARLQLNKTNAFGFHGAEIEKNTTATDGVTQVTTYTYTAGERRYTKSTSTTSSDGSVLTTSLTYPHELEPEYSGLVAKNMLNQPVIVQSFENDELLTILKTRYNTQEFPEEVLSAKGDDDLESRMVLEKYLNGNVTQIRQVDGRPVSFIWGYNDRYVVAKIQNIEYDDLPPPLVNQIRSTTDESQLLVHLNTLQNTLNTHKMSLYTYYPNIGVSTMIDASGDSLKYYYDPFQRLDWVEDQDGNVLSENEYNYKN